MNTVLINAFMLSLCGVLLATDKIKSDKFDQSEKSPNPKKLICFYVMTNAFNPQIMNGLCSHINIGFFGISKTNHTLEVTEEHEEILSEVMLLKKKEPHLKIIISVGGAGDLGFSEMVVNHTTRKIFIRSCMDLIKKYKADGLDLDWEWPVVSNGDEREKVKFVQLLHEVKTEFNRHKKNYILSADVPSARAVIELGYYANYISDYVDYVNVMCYDYHFFTKYFPFTGHNSPLYSSYANLFTKDINQSIAFWIENSMPREKIVLGIPTYGHSFELTFSHLHSLVAPAKGFGSIGHDGFVDYPQICNFLKHKDTTVVYDEVSKVPYAYKYPDWISYDDQSSLAAKANYVRDQDLSGVMIYSVNSDDYSGICHGNTLLPLITKVRNILLHEV